MNNKSDRVITMEEFEEEPTETTVATVLDSAKEIDFEHIVLIGLRKNGSFSFMSSSNDYRDIIMYCESFKYMAMKQVFDD